MRFSWSVSCFCFQFYFSLFAAINGWSHNVGLEGDILHFSFAKNTPFFHSYRFNECSLFLLLRLACIFCLDFCSDLVISFHKGVFLPLIFIGFHQKRCL
jgi:hypothetical protein